MQNTIYTLIAKSSKLNEKDNGYKEVSTDVKLFTDFDDAVLDMLDYVSTILFGKVIKSKDITNIYDWVNVLGLKGLIETSNSFAFNYEYKVTNKDIYFNVIKEDDTNNSLFLNENSLVSIQIETDLGEYITYYVAEKEIN